MATKRPDGSTVVILVLIAVLTAAVWVAGHFGAFAPVSVKPAKIHTVDGCDVYRFVDESETGYFVRCANNKASTSVKGEHVITELKSVPPVVKSKPTATVAVPVINKQ